MPVFSEGWYNVVQFTKNICWKAVCVLKNSKKPKQVTVKIIVTEEYLVDSATKSLPYVI